MFRSCRKNGLHLVKTKRLWIVSFRACDVPAYMSIGGDPEAQRWLGWAEVPAVAPTGPVELPLRRDDGILWPKLDELYFAGIDRATMHMVTTISIYRGPDGLPHIGGATAFGLRGRGFGTEAMIAVCDLAHHHFGLAELRAGCETTNTASATWLGKAGFRQIDGPPTHELPDGRVISSLWWSHTSPMVRRRCPWLS